MTPLMLTQSPEPTHQTGYRLVRRQFGEKEERHSIPQEYSLTAPLIPEGNPLTERAAGMEPSPTDTFVPVESSMNQAAVPTQMGIDQALGSPVDIYVPPISSYAEPIATVPGSSFETPIPVNERERLVEPEYSLTEALAPSAVAARSALIIVDTPAPILQTYTGYFNSTHTSDMAMFYNPGALPTPWLLVFGSMVMSFILGLLAYRSNRPDWPVPSSFVRKLVRSKSFQARKEYRDAHRQQRRLRKKDMSEFSPFGIKSMFGRNGNEDVNGSNEQTADTASLDIQVLEPAQVYSPTDGQVDTENLISFTSLPPPARDNQHDTESKEEDHDTTETPETPTPNSNEDRVRNKKIFWRASLALIILTWRTFLALAVMVYCCTKPLEFQGPYPSPSVLFVLMVSIQMALSNGYIPQFFTLAFLINLILASAAFVISTVFTMDRYAATGIRGGYCPQFLKDCPATYPHWKQVGCGARYPRYRTLQTTLEGNIGYTNPDDDYYKQQFPYMELHGFENAVVIIGCTWLFTVITCAYVCRNLLLCRVSWADFWRKPISAEKQGSHVRWSAVRAIAIAGAIIAVLIMAVSVILHAVHERNGEGSWFVDSFGPKVNVTRPEDGGVSWSDCFYVGRVVKGEGMVLKEWAGYDALLALLRVMAMV